MTSLPLFPIHILYDPHVIPRTILWQKLDPLVGQLEMSQTTNQMVRFGLIEIGQILEFPFANEHIDLSDNRNTRLDLRASFGETLNQYEQFPQGYSNPEILLLIGSFPLSDWQPAHSTEAPVQRLVIEHSALILTYWISNYALEDKQRREIVKFLEQISPPDPATGSSHYKIIEPPISTNPEEVLVDTFAKLKSRLEGRIQNRINFV